MATLLPFRDYDEHDVINLFAFDYAGTAVTRGALVKVKTSTGWQAHDKPLVNRPWEVCFRRRLPIPANCA